jgi:two-component sensor histidine kinase
MDRETHTLGVAPGLPLAAVRDFLRGVDGHLPATTRESLALMATELVTNAVRYGEQPVEFAVTWLPRSARIAVRCGGRAFSWHGRSARASLEGGWGLVLVNGLADRWGITPLPGGNEVWAELDHRGGGG